MAYDEETRYRLKRQIYRSSPLSHHPFTHRDGRVMPWFINKLEPAAAWANADKSGLKQWELDATRLRLVECRTQGEVAELMGVNQSSVSRAIRDVLDCIVDQMPEEMALAVLQVDKANNWMLGCCLKCGGDLYYAPDAAGYAEWCCFQCGNREPIGKEKEIRAEIIRRAKEGVGRVSA